jgi:hypothetical protein
MKTGRLITKTGLAGVGLAVFALAAAGCGGNVATVSGTVTYEGQPVGKGAITFLPADGIGPVAGGPIADGHFTVDGMTPGPKVVQVVAVKLVPFARNTEEMARRAAENKSKGDGSGLIDPADTIPADAEGNNATREVIAGKQTLNLDLKKPAKSTGR